MKQEQTFERGYPSQRKNGDFLPIPSNGHVSFFFFLFAAGRTPLAMACCYGSISGPLDGSAHGLSYLPIRTKLADGTPVEIDVFRERCVFSRSSAVRRVPVVVGGG